MAQTAGADITEHTFGGSSLKIAPVVTSRADLVGEMRRVLREADARRRRQHQYDRRVAGASLSRGEEAQVVTHAHAGGADQMGPGPLDDAAP